MRALILAALLSSAPPTPADAQKLATERAWDELYLAWAAVDPKGYGAPARRTIAASLLKGCDTLAPSDALMAYSLGERAVLFEETAPGLLCLARTSLATDQRGGAEEALRRGLAHFPKDGHFGVALGQLLLEDRDPAGALAVLRQVPPRSPEAAQARQLIQRAQGQESQQTGARAEAQAQARDVERRFSGEDEAPRASAGGGDTSGLAYESSLGEDGMRTRANSHFVVKYFNNARDFSQRAEYENRIVSALDEAQHHTRQVLGEARDSPVDVVLYTREEFRTHQGGVMARAAAGLYAAGAIRINDAAELTPETRATLVHEYVHAVVDELAGDSGGAQVPVWLNEGLAEYVEWRYLGADRPPLLMANRLRGAAQGGQLPSLQQLSGQALIQQRDPGLAYALSAMVVRELLGQGGPGTLLGLVREVGRGAAFEDVLQRRYGRSVPELERSVKDALSHR